MFASINAGPRRADRLSGCSVIRWLQLAFVLALLFGCGKHSSTTLGQRFDGHVTTIAAAKRADPASLAIVHGTMIEKCPEAGCWFLLRDESGVIKVDTRDAGFVVVDVPLQVSLTVAGHAATNGAERVLKATGLHY